MIRKDALRVSGLVLLVLAVGCTGSPQIPDSPEKRAEIARSLARISIDGGSLEESLSDGAQLAYNYAENTLQIELGRELMDNEQTKVREILREVLAEFLTAEVWEQTLTDVYAEHFTASELEQFRLFFESPLGKKLTELDGPMKHQIDDLVGAKLESELDAFSARVDEELVKAFPALQEGSD